MGKCENRRAALRIRGGSEGGDWREARESVNRKTPKRHPAAVNKVSVNDLRATILALIGLDHEKPTCRFNGRNFRLTDVAGEVVKEVIAQRVAHDRSIAATPLLRP